MPDLTLLRRILYDDPIWAAYAIADLQPSMIDLCTWLPAPAGNGQHGLVMLFHGMTPTVLFAMGPTDAVAHALSQADLPDSAAVSIRSEHEPVIAHWYDLGADRRPMYRMVLRRAEQLDVPEVDGLVRLHTDDAPRLERLYAGGGDFAPDAFDSAQIANGVFYGIEAATGELLAAGGTHIVDWDAGIGAIGNFYTRVDARRHGHASALLAAIVSDLNAGHVDTIVLNVDQRNMEANRLYERHGFIIHCPYVEGVGVRITG